jgi:hypothetical protein
MSGAPLTTLQFGLLGGADTPFPHGPSIGDKGRRFVPIQCPAAARLRARVPRWTEMVNDPPCSCTATTRPFAASQFLSAE